LFINLYWFCFIASCGLHSTLDDLGFALLSLAIAVLSVIVLLEVLPLLLASLITVYLIGFTGALHHWQLNYLVTS